jgi:hypothetical protein
VVRRRGVDLAKTYVIENKRINFFLVEGLGKKGGIINGRLYPERT